MDGRLFSGDEIVAVDNQGWRQKKCATTFILLLYMNSLIAEYFYYVQKLRHFSKGFNLCVSKMLFIWI